MKHCRIDILNDFMLGTNFKTFYSFFFFWEKLNDSIYSLTFTEIFWKYAFCGCKIYQVRWINVSIIEMEYLYSSGSQTTRSQIRHMVNQRKVPRNWFLFPRLGGNYILNAFLFRLYQGSATFNCTRVIWSRFFWSKISPQS